MFLTLILILPLVKTEVYKFERNFNHSFPGKQLQNHVAHEFSTKFQISQCAMECARTAECQSFNYDKFSKRCQLNNATHEEYPDDLTDVSTNETFDYHLLEAFTIDEEAVGPCGSHPCENNGRCLDTKDTYGQRMYICICGKEWTGQNCQRLVDILQWTPWEGWGSCSVSCGPGFYTRRRYCENMSSGTKMDPTECYGREVEYDNCPYKECPRWEKWSEWGECSTYTTCGRGYKLRHRNCSNGGVAGVDRYCKGPTEETAVCEGIACKGMARIVNGKRYGTGKVEFYDELQDKWFRVCGDRWNNSMADIVCKQTGFEGTEIVSSRTVTELSSSADNSDVQLVTSSDKDSANDTVEEVDYQDINAENLTLECLKGSEVTLQQCVRNLQQTCAKDAVVHCRVTGAWSLWTQWGECSVTCENGTRTRTRECNHPPPNHGGTPCPGVDTQFKLCTLKMCPIDGIWATWTEWSDCSVTCENGTQYRTRECIGPYYKGKECEGDPKEIRDCFPKMCPVDGVWFEWEQWTACTVTCGYGTRFRERDCDGPFHKGANCTGPFSESESCNAFSCPVDGSWKVWEQWDDCSVTCGGGARNRTRECLLPKHGGETCLGHSLETESCNDFNCPVDGFYEEWAEWTDCNVSCGGGHRWRDRLCQQPKYGGAECVGVDFEMEECNAFFCPVNGVWSNWVLWSDCSLTCGNGTQNRSRSCIGPFYGGMDCDGSEDEDRMCNTHECPVDGVFTDWSVWGPCTLSCGRGTMTRNRTCDGPYHGGKLCVGDTEETTHCNPSSCPVDGVWMSWSPWGECNVTCGGGIQNRNRTCDGPYYGGKECPGNDTDTQSCNTFECPIDGVFGTWSEWYNCNVSCGGGIQWRDRSCIGPFYNGTPCYGEYNDSQSCNMHECPIDGIFDMWSEWYNCNVTCGGGIQWRNRSCIGPFYNGTPCYGDYNDSQPCNIHNCPIDGIFNTWSEWYNCNVTCGGGIQWRNRSCIGPFYNGTPCYGDYNDSQNCNMHECPIDGIFSDWSEWYECDLTCGTGIQLRNRSCVGTAFGGMPCNGSYNDSQICNDFECPIDGNWTLWTGWDPCNVTCGGGMQRRYRECSGPFYGGANCTGNYTEIQSCNEHHCPINGTWEDWTKWDECNVTCGGGTQYRYRNCTGPFYGGLDCDGSDVDGQVCNTHNCPVDGIFTEWSEWGSCNVTCGGGIKWRDRTCDGPFHGGASCNGSFNDSIDCNTHPCPIDGVWEDWTVWSQCPVTCGGDISIRARDCDGPYHFGQNCSGHWSEERDCGMDPCPIPGDWFGWTSWSRCSVTCDGGIRSRTRECDMDSYGNLTAPCLGNGTDYIVCHDWPCTPFAKHCTQLGEMGLVDSGYCEVDPDGDGPLTPVSVYCDISYSNTTVVTVIEHSSQQRTYVEGYEQAGGYEDIIDYRISEEHIIAFVNSAESCKQHLKWECVNTVIVNPTRTDVWVTYFTHRSNSQKFTDPKYIAADYFPGADRGSRKCACAMGENTCAKQPDGRQDTCNCNVNDGKWRVDEGDVTYKDHLPIHGFYAGDTGDADEEGYVTVGPVICWGYGT